MKNSTKLHHLQSITIDNFEAWKEDAFTCYASCTSSIGNIQLGVDGNGKPCVYVQRDVKYSFETIDKAIAKYSELILTDCAKSNN